MQGMKTVAISTSEEKRQEALTYGASEFINCTDKDSVKKHAASIDFILMTAHAGTSEQFIEYINLLKPNGELVETNIHHSLLSDFDWHSQQSQ